MTKGVFYAHRVHHGIKIGWTTNYSNRVKQHASNGEPIYKLCLTDKIPNIDEELKKVLKKYKVSVENNPHTQEVYDLPEHIVKKLFLYLSNTEVVDFAYVSRMLNNDIPWTTLTMTIEDFRTQYGTKVAIYAHQRPLNRKHADDLRHYIENNYYKSTYCIPDMILGMYNGKNIIIDGQHRTQAYLDLDENSPILSETISVKCSNIPFNSKQLYEIFQNINKGLEMSEFYINPGFVEELQQYVIEQLKNKYGTKVIRDVKNTPCPKEYITVNDIKEFLSIDNIKKFMEEDDCNVMDKDYFVKELIALNEAMGEFLQVALNNNWKPHCDKKVQDELTEDEIIIVHKYYRILNDSKKLGLKPLLKALNSIKKLKHKKRRIKSLKRKKKTAPLKPPFYIGLIFRRPLYDMITSYDNEISSVFPEIYEESEDEFSEVDE